MKAREFRDALVELAALYALDAPGYGALMDRLAQETTRAQWEYVAEVANRVDTAMVENDLGSVYQVEKYLAEQEGRESRYPPALFMGDNAEKERRVLALEREFATRGLRVQAYRYQHIDPSEEPERAAVSDDHFGFEYVAQRRQKEYRT